MLAMTLSLAIARWKVLLPLFWLATHPATTLFQARSNVCPIHWLIFHLKKKKKAVRGLTVLLHRVATGLVTLYVFENIESLLIWFLMGCSIIDSTVLDKTTCWCKMSGITKIDHTNHEDFVQYDSFQSWFWETFLSQHTSHPRECRIFSFTN